MAILLRGEQGEMAGVGMGKETGGCPRNGWLAAAELCSPFLLPKNIPILMLCVGLALPYLSAMLV